MNSKSFPRWALTLMTPLCLGQLCFAQVISVGSHTLNPNSAGQTIQISVSGGAAVQGLNLYVQIGDGGPAFGGSVPGPSITGMDILSGTIFGGNNSGASPAFSGQVGEVSTTTASGTVSANGLLATLTLDTTGFASGTWALSLSHSAPSLPPATTDFAGIPATITDGSFTISAVPEPSAYAAVFGLASLGLGMYLRRRKTG